MEKKRCMEDMICDLYNTNPQNKSNIYFGGKRKGKDEGRGGKEKVNVRVVLCFGIIKEEKMLQI